MKKVALRTRLPKKDYENVMKQLDRESITSDIWCDVLDAPFEGFLRYAQLPDKGQEKFHAQLRGLLKVIPE